MIPYEAESQTRRTAVVIAPFSPGLAAPHLGAAKKIELVLGLLYRLRFELHLVDSAHPTLAFARELYSCPSQVGDTPIRLWRPPCFPNRKLGKLINVALAHGFMRNLLALSPDLVWVYNSYSFEARAALFLKQRSRCKVVLELEDLPLARRRSLNPKPWLDQYYFPRLLANSDLVTCVNAGLLDLPELASRRKMLLPSLLQQELVDAPATPRFGHAGRRLGYFGGLDAEKGALILLQLVPVMPASWRLVVTGAGEFEDQFRLAQERHPDRIEYHGRVSNEEVIRLMRSCDAIVNPHSPITLMKGGVFPFKVCEALASGAVLISTALPPIEIDLASSVQFFDGSLLGLQAAIESAPVFYKSHATDITRTRDSVCRRYSEAAVMQKLRVELDGILA